MRRFRHLLVAVIVLLGPAGADIPPPAIVPDGIVNAASGLPASLRGGAIAPGMRFLIPGVRLGPEAAVRGSQSHPPLKLAEVSVRIRQGERVVDAGLLLASATSIEGWMPAEAPLGDVELTVTYQGRTSEPYKLTTVPASAGFYSPANAPDILPDARRTVDVSRGATAALWGTGLAGIAEVFVGGVRAEDVQVTPADCCQGVEKIAFRVPAAAPYGCFVPVEARTADNRPTNAVPIAVHPAGEPCRDDLDWFREGVEHARRAGFVALARVSMDIAPVRDVEQNRGSRFQFDYGIASFGRQQAGQRPFPPLPPMGTCTVFTARVNLRQLLGQSRNPREWTSIPTKTRGNLRLDAGGAIRLEGPAGERELMRDPHQQDYYDAFLGGARPFSHQPAAPLYLGRGAYTLAAPGGADIGPFSAKLDATEPLVWKNRHDIETVRRDAGVTVEWKAARLNDAILIVAESADRASGDAAACVCMAPARAGSFHIPPVSLGNLPHTPILEDLDASYLILVELPAEPPTRIEARGLDQAFAAFISVSARPVSYQ